MSGPTNQPTSLQERTPTTDSKPTKTYTLREVRMRRALFWGGIVLWVVILMIPFLFVVLALRGEVSFGLAGDFPDNELRIWMVMEPRERGIGYSSPVVIAEDDTTLQVETRVRYLLWEGDNEALAYCYTYTRDSADDSWGLAGVTQVGCEAGS